MADNAVSLLLVELAEGTWSTALGYLLDRFKPAGILFRKLVGPQATLQACQESARALQSTPFMAIGEEGDGALTACFPALPQALALGTGEAGPAGDLIGRGMAVLGLNLNLSPTLDVETSAGAASEVGTTDSGGRQRVSPAELAKRAGVFVGALASHRVLCCGRHFPGLPSRQAALQKRKTIVADRSLAALWREELVPYRTLGNKLAAVEISHAVHRAYDYEFLRPASLSPGVIEGLLRAKLHYRGLALADASLAAQAAGIDADEAVVRALAAGCDLVLVPGEPSLLERIGRGLERAAGSGRLPGARIAEAIGRVKTARESLPRPPRKLASAQYSRVARDFEEFAQKWKGGRNA